MDLVNNQTILPALRQLGDLRKILESSYETFVVLDIHISQLMHVRREAKKYGKRIFLHADLIHGLKTDDYGADFLCHDVRPDGIVSTRANVLKKAKKKDIIAIQRMFLLDSLALEKSYALVEQIQPDYIEVLPGIIPEMVAQVREKTGIPVISGGLIQTPEQIDRAIEAGAIAVTTSDKSLWRR